MKRSAPSVHRSILAPLLLWLFCPFVLFGAQAPSAILVRGVGGEKAYEEAFARWQSDWEKACRAGQVRTTAIGPEPGGREALKHALEAEPKEGEPLWLILFGHGTFDGRDGKFNLREDDVSADELAAWLRPFQRTVVVIAAFSSSGVWLKPLSAPGRVILTATRSHSENNYARLGGFLATAFAAGSDLDKDGQTSLLEAWLAAARSTMSFYKNEGRLATEHSLLEDNGDGLGTPADWFQGTRPVKKSKAKGTPDGLRASQLHLVPNDAERALHSKAREERDALERELAALRERKKEMSEDDYLTALERVLLKIARLYQQSGPR